MTENFYFILHIKTFFLLHILLRRNFVDTYLGRILYSFLFLSLSAPLVVCVLVCYMERVPFRCQQSHLHFSSILFRWAWCWWIYVHWGVSLRLFSSFCNGFLFLFTGTVSFLISCCHGDWKCWLHLLEIHFHGYTFQFNWKNNEKM